MTPVMGCEACWRHKRNPESLNKGLAERSVVYNPLIDTKLSVAKLLDIAGAVSNSTRNVHVKIEQALVIGG